MKLLKTQTRSSIRIACTALKAIASIFMVARNSVYKAKDLTKVLVSLCIKKTSAERSSKPSPDTLLRRLRNVDERVFNQVLRGLNHRLLGKLGLRRRVVLALDFRTLAYYGAEQPALVSDSRLRGTRLGIRFAMLSVVEAGRTFVLHVKQATPLHSKVGILREMLQQASLKPRLLLLDRGFYTVEVILALKPTKTHFLMAARRTAPIKRLCKLFERGEIPPVVDYVIRSSGKSVLVKLIFVRRKTKRGWETHVFVSDLPIDPQTASDFYRCRWRIETNNREVLKFMARTTSQDMKLRRVYYALATLLYNLWIVFRGGTSTPRSHEFKRTIIVVLSFSLIVRASDQPPPL